MLRGLTSPQSCKGGSRCGSCGTSECRSPGWHNAGCPLNSSSTRHGSHGNCRSSGQWGLFLNYRYTLHTSHSTTPTRCRSCPASPRRLPSSALRLCCQKVYYSRNTKHSRLLCQGLFHPYIPVLRLHDPLRSSLFRLYTGLHTPIPLQWAGDTLFAQVCIDRCIAFRVCFCIGCG